MSILGRSAPERAKSITIGLLAGLMTLALWQVWIGHTSTLGDEQDRHNAANVAAQFGTALTTYDYSHLNVQITHVAPVSTSAVRALVTGASGDIVAAQASSIGDVIKSTVVSITGSQAEVLVGTSQLMVSRYSLTPTTIAGLLDVTLRRAGDGWVVTDFRWLVTPSEAP